jgi:hypothetical protein
VAERQNQLAMSYVLSPETLLALILQLKVLGQVASRMADVVFSLGWK